MSHPHVHHPMVAAIKSGKETLPLDRCLTLYTNMVRSRCMEERMIKMSKSGQGYFWIGGPGEEAFNTCLGMQVRKGQGPAFDYLHLSYRNSATLIAMGMPMIDGIRQMAMTATDSNSMGRNFVGHYAKREWNVVPVSSVIEIQFTMAVGTALIQKRQRAGAISIVVGGDAGSAEGDFASCMVWSSRPNNEVPVLMIVMNNGAGISTPTETQHSEEHIFHRGQPFGIPGELVDGNDPIASWHAVERGMNYCRQNQRPYIIEAKVSRLYGHSSSSGALRVPDQADCIANLGQALVELGVAERSDLDRIRNDAESEADTALETALNEPRPTAADIPRHTYAPSPVDAIYPNDYTGLPR